MKKYHLILLLTFSLFSCNNDEELTTTNNSALLQKVVFYRNSSKENHWNFNNNGLLDNISQPNGTLIEKFKYDANNNVIEDIKYTNGVAVVTYNIIYNSNNIITKINNITYDYDVTTNKYYYSNGNQSFICLLNNDKLATNYTLIENSTSGTNEVNYEMVYVNGNMNSFKKIENTVITNFKEFGYGASTVGGNPLLNATLPVLKVKSLIEPDFLGNAISSKLPIETVGFGSTSNQSENYGWLIDKDGRLSMQSVEVFNSNAMVDSYLYAIIPIK
jgi:hypothetical protein